MPLTVATRCPSCGGGLEFEEGTNAVRCPFCGSSHVVTGRGRVLSYYIPNNIDAREAVSAVMADFRARGDRGWRISEATQFFVPFLHYTAQVLRWEVQEVAAAAGEGVSVTVRSLGIVGADELLAVISGAPAPRGSALTEKRFELTGRHLDRSMPALDAHGLGVYSLGIRPGVLKLSLFEKGAVASRGLIAPARFGAEEKEELGFAPADNAELYFRGVFAKSRSLVYFPFWVVEAARNVPGDRPDGRALFVVDAVAGGLTARKAGMELLDALMARDGQGFETVGFRPLKCPNCAADLPVRPRDVVFFCGGCAKAWHLTGSGFDEIRYTVAAPAAKRGEKPVYIPFWVVTARMGAGGRTVENKFDLMRLAPGLKWPTEEDKKVPLRFFLPAARMGNLRALSRLASTFTRFQPVFTPDKPDVLDARGSYLSPEDALTLAPLILFSIIPKGNINAIRFALDAKVEPLGAELALVPFYRGRFDMTDGLFAQSVPLAALKD